MPIRVLYLTANPNETAPLQLQDEIRDVKAAIAAGVRRETIEMTPETGVRIRELQHLIDGSQPDIVHFSGHGRESHGQIVLLDDDGKAFPVPIDALADALADVGGVVLNACASAPQAEAIAKRGPWAIGMSGLIKNDSAMAFSRSFYGKLADGLKPEKAFPGAKNQLALLRLEGADLPQWYPSIRPPKPARKPETKPRVSGVGRDAFENADDALDPGLAPDVTTMSIPHTWTLGQAIVALAKMDDCTVQFQGFEPEELEAVMDADVALRGHGARQFLERLNKRMPSSMRRFTVSYNAQDMEYTITAAAS